MALVVVAGAPDASRRREQPALLVGAHVAGGDAGPAGQLVDCHAVGCQVSGVGVGHQAWAATPGEPRQVRERGTQVALLRRVVRALQVAWHGVHQLGVRHAAAAGRPAGSRGSRTSARRATPGPGLMRNRMPASQQHRHHRRRHRHGDDPAHVRQRAADLPRRGRTRPSGARPPRRRASAAGRAWSASAPASSSAFACRIQTPSTHVKCSIAAMTARRWRSTSLFRGRGTSLRRQQRLEQPVDLVACTACVEAAGARSGRAPPGGVRRGPPPGP